MEASRNSVLVQNSSFEASCQLEQKTHDCFAQTSHPYDSDTSKSIDVVKEKCLRKLHHQSRSSPASSDSYRVKRDHLLVPLNIIDETLKEQGYQYGQGKNFPQQIKDRHLDCELSTLAYLLILNRLKQEAVTPENYALTSMHGEEPGSHVCIRALLEDEPILWETSIGSSARVEKEEYQAKFSRIRHHSQQEINNLPVSILASYLVETNKAENLLNWLDHLLISPEIYPSPEFYSFTILSLLSKNVTNLVDLHRLYDSQIKISNSTNSRECLLNNSILAMHIAACYQESDQHKEALSFYQLGLKDIQRAKKLKITPHSTFALGHCFMNLFLLTGKQKYRTQAIKNFEQVLELANLNQAVVESLTKLNSIFNAGSGDASHDAEN